MHINGLQDPNAMTSKVKGDRRGQFCALEYRPRNWRVGMPAVASVILLVFLGIMIVICASLSTPNYARSFRLKIWPILNPC